MASKDMGKSKQDVRFKKRIKNYIYGILPNLLTKITMYLEGNTSDS